MSELIQPVKDGKLVQTAKSSGTGSSQRSNQLDKNAFLRLLTTQMKYQDPLNPNTDTEYVAQLATFSQLEQLQNLGTISTNTMAFSLVGREVVIKTENANGNTSYINGRVDFVTITGNTTKLSVNGSLYSIDQLESVISSEYLLEQNLPGVPNKVELLYDAADPKDQSFIVKLGAGDTVADKVAVILNEKLIDMNLVELKDNKVTIKKEAFEGLENGVYKLIITFNDPYLTTITDKVTLKVQNVIPKDDDDENPTGDDDQIEDTEQTEPANSPEATGPTEQGSSATEGAEADYKDNTENADQGGDAV